MKFLPKGTKTGFIGEASNSSRGSQHLNQVLLLSGILVSNPEMNENRNMHIPNQNRNIHILYKKFFCS